MIFKKHCGKLMHKMNFSRVKLWNAICHDQRKLVPHTIKFRLCNESIWCSLNIFYDNVVNYAGMVLSCIATGS